MQGTESALGFLKILMESQKIEMSVWQHGCLSCYLDVLVDFGQIFVLFVGNFIVYSEYYLFIVNATSWHVFVEDQKEVIFIGVVAKH